MISRFSFWSKIAYIFVVTWVLFLLLSNHVYDDPFITYRYAKNLRDGLGFVYNQGEFVLSTTTPMFTLILAVFGYLWSDIQLLANFIGALSVSIGGLLIWELGKTWEAPFVGWCGLLLYPTFPLLLSTLGSETPVFLTFVLSAFVLYSRHKIGSAIMLIAFAVLIRSDAVLVGILLVGHHVWINRNRLRQASFWREQPWLWIVAAFGLLLVWHGFAWIYFGSPLPVTLAAKQAQGRMAISELFAPGVLRIAKWYAGRWQYWLELALVLVGIIFSLFNHRRWILILAWTGLYFLSYTVLGVTRYFWYYAPLVPGWVIAMGLGITFLTWLHIPEKIQTPILWNKIRLGVIVLILGLLLGNQLNSIINMTKNTDPRYAIYRAAGEWLAKNTPEDAYIGTLEVGIIGYFSQRSMIDFAGLIQPPVAEQLQLETTYDDAAIWAVNEYSPDYVLLFPDSFSRLENGYLRSSCEITHQLFGVEHDFPTDLTIYKCQ